MNSGYGENVRLPTGQLRDELRQPLWDTIDIANGESPVGQRRFFQTAAGKTLAQTNLKQNGSLEAQTSFLIQGLQLEAQNYNAANAGVLPVIQENSSLTLTITNKDYYQGNMMFLTGRMSESAAAATTAPATTINRMYQRFAWQAVQGVKLVGKECQPIRPLANFYVTWVVDPLSAAQVALATPSAGAGLPVRFIMKLTGLLRRPVQ